MLKVLKITLILIILTSSVAFAQRRNKKERKKEKQEKVSEGEEEPTEEEPIEEEATEEEPIEEEPAEEDVEEEEVDEEQAEGEEEYDDDEDDYDDEEESNEEKSEKKSPDLTKSIKPEQSAYKKRSGPSKVALFLERFQFNLISGAGLTSWKSGNYKYAYYNKDENLPDTSLVKYKGAGLNVPFHLQLLFNAGRFRIGGGYSYDFYWMEKLKPKAFEEELDTYFLKDIGRFRKYYGHLGYKYFQNRLYAYSADVEIGMFKGTTPVNTAQNSDLPFINMGITLERKYSEYFKLFLRPSVEYKAQPYTLNNPPFDVNNHKLITFYASFGLSYTIPLVRKCPIKSCGIRVHHHHGTRVYRGNPFQRLQNPHYGEEDRKFIRDRGKNKKKLDPY